MSAERMKPPSNVSQRNETYLTLSARLMARGDDAEKWPEICCVQGDQEDMIRPMAKPAMSFLSSVRCSRRGPRPKAQEHQGFLHGVCDEHSSLLITCENLVMWSVVAEIRKSPGKGRRGDVSG